MATRTNTQRINSMVNKLSLLSILFFIPLSCHAAANGVDDEYLKHAVAHLQQSELHRQLHDAETARREYIGSLLINKDLWQKDEEMSNEQKEALDFGFNRSNIRNSINNACLSQLMDAHKPWHAGSSARWVAVKRMLAHALVADMHTFENLPLGGHILACLPIPITCTTFTIMEYCSPAAGISVFGCCTGIASIMIALAQAQRKNRGERIFKAIDWLGCNTTWQQCIAQAIPLPMTMDDIVNITACVYEYPPKQKRE